MIGRKKSVSGDGSETHGAAIEAPDFTILLKSGHHREHRIVILIILDAVKSG